LFFFSSYCTSLVNFFNRIFVANDITVQLNADTCLPATDTHHNVIFEQIILALADWLKLLFYCPRYESIPLNCRCFLLLVLIVTAKTQVSSLQFNFPCCLSTRLFFLPTDGNTNDLLVELVGELNAVSAAKKLL
jgi:hypothetical protein